jgi:hypothetical protein
LKRPRIAHCRDLLKGGRWIVWVCAGAEDPVKGDAVDVVSQVEAFGQGFQAQPFRKLKTAAQAATDAQEIESGSGVAVDEHAIDGGTSGSALNGVRAGRDIERQRRVVLQEAARLEAVTDSLPSGIPLRQGRMDRAVENQAVALIVVGTAVVLPDVEIVDGRAEEELADVIEGLGIGIGNTKAGPCRRALHKRDVQAVIMRISQR